LEKVYTKHPPFIKSYTSDYALAKNAIAFVILSDGIPIIYAGQEQHYNGGNDPDNREATWLSGYNTSAELYQFIASANAIRTQAISKDSGYLTYKVRSSSSSSSSFHTEKNRPELVTNKLRSIPFYTQQNWPIYQDTTTLAMRKGTDGNQLITILSNLGSSGSSYTLSLSGTGYSAGESLTELLSCTSSVTVDSSGNVPVPMADGLPRVLYPSALLEGSGICQ
jgi:alpha-amylase